MERVLPTGTMEIVIDLRGGGLRLHDRLDPCKTQDFAGALVAGPHTRFFVIDTSRPGALLGVHFRPGGAFPFFDLPISELGNVHVPLAALWGSAAAELSERVTMAQNAEAIFSSLEQSLLLRLSRPDARHRAIAFALAQLCRAAQSWKIADLAEHVGLSQRRFIDLFGSEVGLRPKRFSRVLRFQRALRLINRTTAIDWTALALDCGYYDQAHFIHDFQEFCSVAPTAYAALRSEHENHLRHPAAT